jgi:hypothetical protein
MKTPATIFSPRANRRPHAHQAAGAWSGDLRLKPKPDGGSFSVPQNDDNEDRE